MNSSSLWFSVRSFAFLWFAVTWQSAFAADASLNDAEIKAILVDRIDTTKRGVGIVVGIINEQGQRVVSYGSLNQDKKQAVDGDTIFEIGSITKVFTTLLLQDMVERGEVKLEDPVAKYLPKNVKVPTRKGKEITLLSLATLSSGLPRMPEPFLPKDAANPYGDYTADKLYAFLSGYELKRDIGEKTEYSNLGMGLLGHALTLKAGQKYETLVVERIAHPLKMESTFIAISPEFKARLATGHNDAGEAVPTWEWENGCLIGAGGLRSTVNDLLKFVSANVGLAPSPMTKVMQKTHEIRVRNATPNAHIALGWHVIRISDRDIIWHNGGTYGFHSFLGFDPERKCGVVVLSNTANTIDDIGFHLLDRKYPLAKLQPPPVYKIAKVDPAIYKAYVGSYEINPQLKFTIRRDGDRLLAVLSGQGELEIYPKSETDFFYKAVEAEISFVKNDQGDVTELVLHQNGQHIHAKKLNKKE